MKVLVLDEKSERHFQLMNIAAYSQKFQFASKEDMRHHTKLLDALEAISIEAKVPGGRQLLPNEQKLVLDDAWLALLKNMATPPNTDWLTTVTREVISMLDFLDTATDYIPTKEPEVQHS